MARSISRFAFSLEAGFRPRVQFQVCPQEKTWPIQRPHQLENEGPGRAVTRHRHPEGRGIATHRAAPSGGLWPALGGGSGSGAPAYFLALRPCPDGCPGLSRNRRVSRRPGAFSGRRIPDRLAHSHHRQPLFAPCRSLSGRTCPGHCLRRSRPPVDDGRIHPVRSGLGAGAGACFSAAEPAGIRVALCRRLVHRHGFSALCHDGRHCCGSARLPPRFPAFPDISP